MPIKSQSVEEIVNKILEYPVGTKIVLLAPAVYGEKGTHKELLADLMSEGYIRVRINGEMYDLSDKIELDKNKKDNIEVVVDRLVLKEDIRSRLSEGVENGAQN